MRLRDGIACWNRGEMKFTRSIGMTAHPTPQALLPPEVLRGINLGWPLTTASKCYQNTKSDTLQRRQGNRFSG